MDFMGKLRVVDSPKNYEQWSPWDRVVIRQNIMFR